MSIHADIALKELPLGGLSYRCQQETKRYWQRQASDVRYCYELFRRALQTPHEESSKDAWEHVYHQYHRQVALWVKRHPLFPQTDMEAERLADLALEKMWLAFARTPGKFVLFPQSDLEEGLSALLRFLKTCVHSVVLDAIPYNRHDEISENCALVTPESFDAKTFWDCIYERLKTAKERLVADASFVAGLKPQQVYALYTHLFRDVREVYRIKENILDRFRRDPSLRDCLER